jgi:MoxR-like ATPase
MDRTTLKNELNKLSRVTLRKILTVIFGEQPTGQQFKLSRSQIVNKIANHEDVEAAVAAMNLVAGPRVAQDDAAVSAQLADLIKSLSTGARIDEERVRVIAEEVAADKIDTAMVQQMIDQAVAGIAPVTERIVVSPVGEVTVKGHTHPMFKKVLALVAAGINVLLVGPAGCGKTHLAHQIAEALGRDYGTLHCTSGASESQLAGWLLPIKEGGAFEYVASQFVKLYEKGNSVFLLDEIDAADPNMLLFINGALANGHLHVPQRHENPTIARGENAAIIAAANTYGTGADMVYAGRNQLDGATLDRFYVVKMDYDRDFEKQLAPRHITDWAWRIRDRAAELKLRRVISTRTIQKAATACAAGLDWDEVKADMLAGWTKDEMAKVGV